MGMLVVSYWLVPFSESFISVKNNDVLLRSSFTSRRVSGIYVGQSYFRMPSSIMSGRRQMLPSCCGYQILSDG